MIDAASALTVIATVVFIVNLFTTDTEVADEYRHRNEKVKLDVVPITADAFKGQVGVTDADLSRVVDEGWDPPVTLGVRLVSVISDGLQHAGQAAFIRGILLRSARRG